MPRKKKGTKKNTLICSVPGLSQPLEIAFESRKLPVCKKCKKIYKTRELCRVRDGHTTLPWNTTYICFLVDDSCIENGKLIQNEGDTFTAETIADDKRPGPFYACLDKLGPNPPICLNCKEKNYTRYHCRTNHCHQQLPWGTTYVTLKRDVRRSNEGDITDILSATSVASGDDTYSSSPPRHSISSFASIDNSPSTAVTVPSLHCTSTEEEDIGRRGDKEESDRPLKKIRSEEENQPVTLQEDGKENVYSEDISQIQESKAFLLVVHDEIPTVHWLRTKPLTEASFSQADEDVTNTPNIPTQNDFLGPTKGSDHFYRSHSERDSFHSPQGHRHGGHSSGHGPPYPSPLLPPSWRDGQSMDSAPYGHPPNNYNYYGHHQHHGNMPGPYYPPTRNDPRMDYNRYNRMDDPNSYNHYPHSHYTPNDHFARNNSMNYMGDSEYNHHFPYHGSHRRPPMPRNHPAAYGPRDPPHPHSKESWHYHENHRQHSWDDNKRPPTSTYDFDTFVRDGPDLGRSRYTPSPQSHNFPSDFWNKDMKPEAEKMWAIDSKEGQRRDEENGKYDAHSKNHSNKSDGGLHHGRISPV